MSVPAPIAPGERLLCGPGPSNVEPGVQAAMQQPVLGHMDPDLFPILDEIASMLAEAWGQKGGIALALQATGTAGMEAGIESLIEPGDTAVVAVAGYFGMRIVDICTRHGANVVEVTAPFGQPVPQSAIADAVEANGGARVVAVVLAETSTGVRQPIDALGEVAHAHGALLIADAVTALGGIPVDFAQQGIDYAYSCSQKCLGAPPGLAPVALSERALERIEERRTPTGFTFDFGLLEKYWRARPPAYHHTAPVLHLYALHEALRQLHTEGLERRHARHSDAGNYFQDGLRRRGLSLLAEAEHQLPQLTAVNVPDGVGGKDVQTRLLSEHSIEVGGGLGPAFPPIWRIGLMGVNATREVGDRLLAALDSALGTHDPAA